MRRERLAAPATVARGTVWNLAGRLGPMVVAVAATPFLLHLLGTARFGVFSLALSLIGIFGIFDFGFGRAITRLIAERAAEGREDEAAPAVLTGLALLTALGAVGGVAAALGARAYVTHLMALPAGLEDEVARALALLCLSAPLVVLNAALWGVLAAFQRFGRANLVNVPIMALYYLGPLAVLPFADSLVAVIAVLVLCRLLMTGAYLWIALDAMPSLRRARPDTGAIGPLVRFGGWLTVSNLTWPALLYLDRFVIAALISAEATAWYSTPFDLVLRFSIVPIAIMQAGFPALAASYRSDPEGAAGLFRAAVLAIVAAVFPAALVCALAAKPLLALWLGAGFAAHAATVLALLGAGSLFMCADTAPSGLLDAIGRPEANAKLSLALLAAYVPMLAAGIHFGGIEGAAAAWAARVTAGFGLRLWLCRRHFPALAGETGRLLPPLGAALLALAAGLYSPPAGLAGAALVAVVLWGRGLRDSERAYVVGRLRPAR